LRWQKDPESAVFWSAHQVHCAGRRQNEAASTIQYPTTRTVVIVVGQTRRSVNRLNASDFVLVRELYRHHNSMDKNIFRFVQDNEQIVIDHQKNRTVKFTNSNFIVIS
jgi:hypothetical protein